MEHLLPIDHAKPERRFTMTTFKTLCIAGITALILPLGAATPASAQEALVNFSAGEQDPFEISKQNCIDKGLMNSACVTITSEFIETFGNQALCDIAHGVNSNINQLRSENGWGNEVTCETLLKVGDTFVFG
jgi:hypothetical protein